MGIISYAPCVARKNDHKGGNYFDQSSLTMTKYRLIAKIGDDHYFSNSSGLGKYYL